MTVKAFCSSGHAEPVKASVHAAAGTLLGVMAAYNGVAWCYRRERHLGWNAVIYVAALVWELRQTRRHFRRRAPQPAVIEPRPEVLWARRLSA
ncbi:MAG: hypothetical protein ACRD26_10575 [Vicinamibacterales bacterium]